MTFKNSYTSIVITFNSLGKNFSNDKPALVKTAI